MNSRSFSFCWFFVSVSISSPRDSSQNWHLIRRSSRESASREQKNFWAERRDAHCFHVLIVARKTFIHSSSAEICSSLMHWGCLIRSSYQWSSSLDLNLARKGRKNLENESFCAIQCVALCDCRWGWVRGHRWWNLAVGGLQGAENGRKLISNEEQFLLFSFLCA